MSGRSVPLTPARVFIADLSKAGDVTLGFDDRAMCGAVALPGMALPKENLKALAAA